MNKAANSYVSLELVNGILIASYLCETIDLEAAKSIVQYRLQQFGDKDYPAIIKSSNVKQVTKEARNYFATAESCQKINICAILAKSVLTNVIVNFILHINKPPIPVKLFSDEKIAMKWLIKNKPKQSHSVKRRFS
ncbi:MAG: hypothetical protein K0R26_1166 [Bacteroidota bacterium]|jgi:hypothetical protein|nr:hypothetical protein [Bacteroidota bacterium]